ncbi:MAG: hypothetical protein HGA23_00235 [Bacteroidales bacterium]|nr:hypothetical protein [Bacteroidales bacterium]
MRKKYQQFIIRLTILSLITGILVFILNRLFSSEIIPPALPWLIILFYLVTAVVHYALLRISAMNPRKFVGYFMLATFAKLMVYLVVMVAYVFKVREGMLAFVLSFFMLYIIYTVFEVVTILAQTRE